MRKKVLAISVLTIVLCMSLIAGAVLALFTSESKINIAVSSGTVDVVATIDTSSVFVYSPTAIDADGTITDSTNAANDTTDTFSNGGTAAIDAGGSLILTNMTPGDKVTFTINIKNNSNVNAQYRLLMRNEGNDLLYSNLRIAAEDIQFGIWQALPIGSQPNAVKMTVELPTTAGNECQELSTEIVFSVEAVQGNAEMKNDEVFVTAAGSAAENGQALLAAIDAVSDGGTVYVSAGEFDLPSNTYTSSINGDLSYGILVDKSFTLKGAQAGVSAGDPSRGTAETVIGSTASGYSSGAILFAKYDVDVVIDGFTLEAGSWDLIGNDDPGVRNVTIINNVFRATGDNSTPIKLKLVSGVISDNRFIGTSCGYGVRVNEMSQNADAWGGTVPNNLVIDVTIENNDFSGFQLKDTSRGVVSVNTNYPGEVVVANNNFTGINSKAINKENSQEGISILASDNIGVTAGNISEGVTLLSEYIADGFSYDHETGGYIVSNANGLRYFAQDVNGGDDYAGKTITLTDDIDLAGSDWTPIGTNVDNYCFDGTLDGGGHTISNMSVSASNAVLGGTSTGWETYKNSYNYAGLFGVVTGTVKNLNFTNCTVNVTDNGAASDGRAVQRGDVYAGIVAGVNFGTIEDVTVKDSSVTAEAWLISSAGGVAGVTIAANMSGYHAYVGTVKNCTADNVQVSAVSDGWTANAGGIVGAGGDRLYYSVAQTAYVTGCTVQSSKITADVKGAATENDIDYSSGTTYFGRAYCGGIGGLAVSTSSSSNTVSENTLQAISYATGDNILFQGEQWGYGA